LQQPAHEESADFVVIDYEDLGHTLGLDGPTPILDASCFRSRA
jgi:hypothetical protein